MSLYHNNNVVPKERANKISSRISLGAILLIPLFLLEQTFNQLKIFECQQNTFRLLSHFSFNYVILIRSKSFSRKETERSCSAREYQNLHQVHSAQLRK